MPICIRNLRIYCVSINRTISDSLTRFYSDQYISTSVVRQELFELETKSVTDQFRSSITSRFLSSLSMIRDTTQANALLSAYRTNYLVYLEGDTNLIWLYHRSYDDCNCSSSSTCTEQSTVLISFSPALFFTVPGFCYVIESLLQSTLECFFNQQCIDQLQGYISPSSSMMVTALDLSLPSLYSTNSTIQELVDSLMIEQWNVSVNYEKYYNECRPIQCIYTFETRNDLIYIVTTLFAIAGGLTTVLKFILPRLMKLFRKKRREEQQAARLVRYFMYCIRKQTTRIVPDVSVIET